MYYAFGNHIYSFSPMFTYIFLVWQTYFFFLIYTNDCWNCSLMCISTKCHCPWRINWQPKIFYIGKPYLFLQIYKPLSIPCLVVMFGFCKCPQCFTTVLKCFTFSSHSCSFTSMKTCIPCFDDIFLFPYFLKLYTHVYLYTILMHIKY